VHNQELAIDAFENMKHFMEAVSFKKATLIFLASKLPEKYLEELRSAFIQIDSNGDGRIERKEFKSALDKTGHQYSEVEIT
jgi:Ca2+-binding EF-hand superfamily protein